MGDQGRGCGPFGMYLLMWWRGSVRTAVCDGVGIKSFQGPFPVYFLLHNNEGRKPYFLSRFRFRVTFMFNVPEMAKTTVS